MFLCPSGLICVRWCVFWVCYYCFLNATLEIYTKNFNLAQNYYIQKFPDFQTSIKIVLVLATLNNYKPVHILMTGFTMHTIIATGNMIMLLALMPHTEHALSFFSNIHNCWHNYVLQLQGLLHRSSQSSLDFSFSVE